MTAYEYLSKLEVMNIKLMQRMRELDQLKDMAVSFGCLKISPDKVQSSPKDKKLEETIAKYIDLEKEVEQMIDDFANYKHQLIDEIQSISAGDNTAKYIQVLYLRYVEFKDLAAISSELHRSYSQTSRIYNNAMDAFDKQIFRKKGLKA